MKVFRPNLKSSLEPFSKKVHFCFSKIIRRRICIQMGKVSLKLLFIFFIISYSFVHSKSIMCSIIYKFIFKIEFIITTTTNFLFHSSASLKINLAPEIQFCQLSKFKSSLNLLINKVCFLLKLKYIIKYPLNKQYIGSF